MKLLPFVKLDNKSKVDTIEATVQKAEKVLVDKRRVLTGSHLMILNIVCFSMTMFQLYAAGPGNLLPNTLRAIHLAFGLCIAFIIFPIGKRAAKNKVPIYDIVFIVLGISVNLYLVIFFEELTARAGILTTTDFVMGIILIVVLLEASRRVVGPVLTGIAGFFLIYTLYGSFFPAVIAHRGVSIGNLVRHMYLTLEGVYGTALGVSASFIFLFITMGAVLTFMGTGEFLIDMAILAFGKQKGGPAKAAVVSSALFGMISGSSVANICTTGTFTIPLMKKTGYKPYFAGSVEAAASIGGQIMPPVMGAAAFIIAENLGVSYLAVCLAAALPAALYFSGIFFAVHQEAVRLDLKGIEQEDLPKFRSVIGRTYLVLPIFAIIILMVLGYSPAMAGLGSILLAVALSFLKKESRLTPKRLFFAFAEGAKSALEVLIACAVVGFIIGSFTLSGMGLKLASLVIDVGGGSLFITLVLTAIASLALGMGVPTTANYVMMAMITVPAVAAMGVAPMAAHLFCFYYGIISDLTPPVALGALAGAGIARAPFLPTAINATKLGIAAYIGPFFFVYHPALLLGVVPFEPTHLVYILFSFIGLFMISCGLFGHVLVKANLLERIIIIAAALMTFQPGISTSLLGISIFFVEYLYQLRKRTKLKATLHQIS